MARGEFTKIDPYTARRKNSMNDAKIVDDVLGLLEIMSTDGDMCQETHRVNEETSQDCVPLAIRWVVGIGVILAVYLLEIPYVELT